MKRIVPALYCVKNRLFYSKLPQVEYYSMQVLRTGHSTHVVTQVLRNPNKRPSITFMACEKRILPALDCVKN